LIFVADVAVLDSIFVRSCYVTERTIEAGNPRKFN